MTQLLILAVLALSVLAVALLIKDKKKSAELRTAQGKYDDVASMLTKAKESVSKLEIENNKLAPYRGIVEASKHAEQITAKAMAEAEAIQKKANKVLSDASTGAQTILANTSKEAGLITSTARSDAKATREKAEKLLQEANITAQNIVSNAEKQSKEIAGNAYEAVLKAESLQKTAAAMKNIIDGYGDRYIVPTMSLLDSLAEDYSHTQGGEELKRAREVTRSLIKNDRAAQCDYVEENRRTTAVRFVLDAFNGKVDTILASVKQDNYGVLEQKVKDAFELVNHNGAAFRNARITDSYLSSRLSELKWACTVFAIKEREKEEQRKIREQIREEEKAARDYERALKEAQKEEETLAKAMDKVRTDLVSANEEQRLKYEAKLQELQQRLVDAEEKNKRALSMAQQTKSGHVYIISNIGSFGEDVLKIGMTRRLDPMDRVDELGDASVPFDFDVHAMISSENAPELEKALHRRFTESQINKVNPRKEFFKVPIIEIKTALDQMGIAARWTLLAEAREYRESLAIAEKSKENVTAA